MADPTTAGAGWLTSKLMPPFLGFIGSTLMLLYTRELDPRRMAVAVIFGVLAAWLAPPLAVAGLRSMFALAWLPSDGSVEGLMGLLIGLAAINLVGFWLQVSKDPRTALQPAKEGTDNGH